MKKVVKALQAQNLIYIYVLVDEEEFEKSGRDVIRSALYVGKGTGSRMDDHAAEARKALRDPTSIDAASNPEKVKSLAEKLKSGRQIKAFRISAGYSTSEDAYRAEALAITLINSSRGDGEKLLNAVNGKYAVAIADMATHFLFSGSRQAMLPAKPKDFAVLVKTTDKESSSDHFEPLKRRLIYRGKPLDGVTVMASRRTKKNRRAWNPMDPWTNEEALDRARHYWSFKTDTIVGWLNGIERPRFLFAGVPDGANTVIRFIWEIDWTKDLEFHPFQPGGSVGKWGFQLVQVESNELKSCRERYLGTFLKETKAGGKEVQALYGYNMGVRVIGI